MRSLSYKCVNYEKNDISVDYKIHVDMAECSLSLHEIIEILGILMTNAYENIVEAKISKKKIGLVVQESALGVAIEVSNVSHYFTSEEIERIFGVGYSSKGKDRGIGLTQVKQLVQKCGTDIVVENYVKSEENWVRFKIIIPK